MRRSKKAARAMIAAGISQAAGGRSTAAARAIPSTKASESQKSGMVRDGGMETGRDYIIVADIRNHRHLHLRCKRRCYTDFTDFKKNGWGVMG